MESGNHCVVFSKLAAADPTLSLSRGDGWIDKCNIESLCVFVFMWMDTQRECVMYLGLGPFWAVGPAACQGEWPYLPQTFT